MQWYLKTTFDVGDEPVQVRACVANIVRKLKREVVSDEMKSDNDD